MKKLLLTVLALTACDPSGSGNDGGDATLKFAVGTPLSVEAPTDDADTATAGFQYDIIVEPTNNDTSGSVVFRVNGAQRSSLGFENGKVTARLTFDTSDAGTTRTSLITAERESGAGLSIGWLLSVNSK